MAHKTDPHSYEAIIARRYNWEVAPRFQFTSPRPQHDARTVEARIGVMLPDDFKRFLSDVGPFSSSFDTFREAVEAAGESPGEQVGVHGHDYLLNLSGTDEDGLLRVMERERHASSPMPEHLVPFWVEDVQTAKRLISQFYCFDYGRLENGEPLVTCWWSWMSTGPRETIHPYTFLGWLKRKFWLDEDEAKPEFTSPPNDWDDAAAWDEYWRETIENPSDRQFHALQRGHLLWNEIGRIRKSGARRILLAGNGISLEPHVLAHMGFDVTALDACPRACDFVRDFHVEQVHLAQFLQEFRAVHDDLFGGKVFEPDERRSLARVKREYRAGGSLIVTCADMFSYTPTRPFDVIVSNRSIQGFSLERIATLARRLYEWTALGGLCIIETMNLRHGDHDATLEAEFRRAGFVPEAGTGAVKRLIADWLHRSADSEKRILFAHGSG